MRLAAASVLTASILVACSVVSVPEAVEPPPPAPAVGDESVAFAIPDGWSRVDGTASTHYLTTGDPDVCARAGGFCDPTTYVMEPGTMDVAIGAVIDDSGCTEDTRPTWDSRTEARASEMREATYRLTWNVCYPGSDEAILIAADLRVVDLEVRHALLAQLREFIETVVLLR